MVNTKNIVNNIIGDEEDDSYIYSGWKRDNEPNKNIKRQNEDMLEHEQRMNFLQPRVRDFDGKIRRQR